MEIGEFFVRLFLLWASISSQLFFVFLEFRQTKLLRAGQGLELGLGPVLRVGIRVR